MILLLIEILIALYAENKFIRGYLGDVLVVIFLYALGLSFIKIKSKNYFLLGIFIFALIIEWLQLMNLNQFLGLKKHSIMSIIIGNTFSWGDIFCYAGGCILTFLMEKITHTAPKNMKN